MLGVFVVDHDRATARIVAELLPNQRLPVATFSTAESFLEAYTEDTAGCLVVEHDLKGMSGRDLQSRVAEAGFPLEVVMIGRDPEMEVVVQAMKAGAIDFVRKPCNRQILKGAIGAAVAASELRLDELQQQREIWNRYESLTEDERRILVMVSDGKPNKLIARALDLSPRTIDFRRASLMKKMRATSVMELARLMMRVEEFSLSTRNRRVSLAPIGVAPAETLRPMIDTALHNRRQLTNT